MQQHIQTFKQRLEEVKVWLQKELSTIRTGRASIAILDSVFVEVYGSKSPLNQVASVNMEDAKTIKIVPWDKSILSEIEKSINKSDLGLSVSSGAEGVRVIFPDLTSETRTLLVKQAFKKIEEAKISMRTERSEILKKIEQFAKENSISEDEVKRTKDEIQKEVDSYSTQFDELGTLKEKEIII